MSTPVKEHPIIFSSEMIREILINQKTQTRRVIKPQPEFVWGYGVRWGTDQFAANVRYLGSHQPDPWIICPYGQPGDRIWAREIWAPMCRVADPFCACDEEAAKANHYIEYKADTGNPLPGDWPEESREDEGCPKWRSPIFMPRWASRITLEIVSVRVERLQDISDADAFAEGISGGDWLGDPVGEFKKLWDSINEKRGFGWDTNCWVWVLEFKRIL